MKNKINRYWNNYKIVILILLFVLIESFLILDAISIKFLKQYGLLVTLSIMPCIYMFFWSIKSKSKLLGISTSLGIFTIIIIYFLLFWNCYHSIFGLPCLCKPCLFSFKHYLSVELVLILSLFYGLICAFSCFLGLKLTKVPSLDEKFSEITKNIIFISVAVIIYLFLIERIIEGKYFEFDPFMMGFLSIIIAISSLYVIFGYFSQDKEGNPIPIIFFIYSFLSFIIGSTFSILVLQFTKNIHDPRILPTHWIFLCIWTLFIAGIIFVLSKDILGLSTNLKYLLGKCSK